MNSRLDGRNSDGWSRNGDEDSGSSTPFQAKKEGGWAGQKRRRNEYLSGPPEAGGLGRLWPPHNF